MEMLPQLGKMLVVLGAVILVAGIVMIFADGTPFLGKLPGDFVWRKGNTTIYFPLVTMLIVSALLTLVLNLFGRGK